MKQRLQLESEVTARQFAFFRVVFGIYLSWHFASLIPYAGEIFSREGIMGNGAANPFHGKWPNPFFIWGSPLAVQASLAAGVAASLCLLIGRWVRGCALLLWFLHSCLFTANPLTANPSLGYVGLLLLLCAAVPGNARTLPGWIPRSAWILLAVGYSFSGALKLGSPSWADGSALQHLMHNPLARPGAARDLMLALPEEFLMLMTWATLALEVLFVPLAYWRRTRPYAWSAMLLMHLGIMATVDFADLSLGMVMAHLFTYQSAWPRQWEADWKRAGGVLSRVRRRVPAPGTAAFLLSGLVLCWVLPACSNKSPHNGIFPFSAMEKPPGRRSVERKLTPEGLRPQTMAPVARYTPSGDRADFPRHTARLRAGDVIAFHMSHAAARAQLRQGKIQKLPYELFRYGHVSIIVPDPAKPLREQQRADLKLLQVAMKQAVTATDSLDYLRDKPWVAYRPPTGSIDTGRLHEFARESVRKCSSPKSSYDFRATFGLGNGNLAPRSLSEVQDRYTCATLIVAALAYSGFDLHAEKRGGWLDVLTPRQVTDAWGSVRTRPTP